MYIEFYKCLNTRVYDSRDICSYPTSCSILPFPSISTGLYLPQQSCGTAINENIGVSLL